MHCHQAAPLPTPGKIPVDCLRSLGSTTMTVETCDPGIPHIGNLMLSDLGPSSDLVRRIGTLITTDVRPQRL
jgi:hypothetical protein